MRAPLRAGGAVACLVALGLLAPAAAYAHGLPAPPGVPVPGFVFAWAAAVVLVVSFFALGALWRSPRLEDARERSIALPAVVEAVCGTLGIALFAFLLVCGFAGSASPLRNVLPTFVYVVFWVALVPLSLLFGDVFSLFNPWRAAARAAAPVARRLASGRAAPRFAYPQWLGHWPAVLTILGFAWLELVYAKRSNPETLAALGAGYCAAQLLGMGLFGIRTWTARGDGIAVYFRLFSRIAPLGVQAGRLVRRPFLSGLASMAAVPGTVALLCVMIGSTSFDGLSATIEWRQLLPHLVRRFDSLGLGSTGALEAALSVGLVVMIAIIALVFGLGIRGLGSVLPGSGRADRARLARQFVHSLVPIAAGYVLAHYLTFLIGQGQALISLVSDPLGTGANLFGTAGRTIDYHPLANGAVWAIQVTALVGGHVCALAVAHDRALVLFRGEGAARRSQQWMLMVMVAYTGWGLWLLSSIAR